MKKLTSFVLVLLALCAFTALASAQETHTVTDMAGIEVTVPVEIDRIVVADIYPLPSVLSIFFNSAEKLVGVAGPAMNAAKNSLLSELYPEILEARSDFIDGTNINVEELLMLEPDVVFYSAGSPQIGSQLNEIGIPAIAISPSLLDYDAIATLNQWFELLSQLFPGNADRAKTVADYSQQVYDRVQERVSGLSDDERERIFFLFQYNDSSIATSGLHFFGQYWANAVGAVNVGEELDVNNAAPVNMEQIYTWNPDRILITNFNSAQPEDLYNNSIGSFDWSEVDAVKNQKVSKMPLGFYRSYTCGVDTPITLLWMAKTVYPDLFADVDITAEVQNYYKLVFDLDLSEEQVDRIFAPESAASAF